MSRMPRWRAALLIVSLAGCAGASAERVASSSERREAPSYSAPDPTDHLLSDARQISAGGAHTCALHANGRVTCWGDNSVGQLGDGTRVGSRVPVVVRALPPARWVSAGARSTCAATLDGEVYCWGANSVGQLGNGEQATGHTLPVRVEGVEGAWLTRSSSDAERSCAVTDAGVLACWGQLSPLGEDGRPLFGSVRPEREHEVRGVTAVAIGSSHECVLTEGGAVWCRGYGPSGELGTRGAEVERAFAPVRGLDDVVAIAAGARHTCAVREEGSAWCWGDNARGQLGNGHHASQPVPAHVVLPVSVRAIAVGDAHACALGERGDAYCWGENASAQLGDGTDRSTPRPQIVRMGAQAMDLAVGARHSCAVVAGGGVRCWGDNRAGQLGDGAFGDRAWPVAVLAGPELDEAIAAAMRD